jgi:predicted nuclease with RNAse H fold
MFIGIDVHLKSLMVAVLDDKLNICQLTSFETEQAAELIREAKPSVIGIDAPYKLNQGLMNHEDYRQKLQNNLKGHYNKKVSEYELSRRNIQPFSTPGHISKLVGWNAWMWAGFKLYNQIEDLGYELITSKRGNASGKGFGEVFPHACFTTMLGYIPSAKETERGLSERVQLLKDQGVKDVELWVTGGKGIKGDKLDALMAAYTAYLVSKEAVSFVGEPSEGEIILPVAELKDKYSYSEEYKEERRTKKEQLKSEGKHFEQLSCNAVNNLF